MALPGVNRYGDLIGAIVQGSFYASQGTVVPYRSGSTAIRLTTTSVNTAYGIYFNELYVGTVDSDSEGNIVFDKHLMMGDNEITLVNLTTNRKMSTWVTARDYAIWHIAYADVFESIDDDYLETKNDLSIENVTLNGIEDRFGSAISTYNNMGQSLNDYRHLVHELRLAYRNYGGCYRGLETAVGAFTQVLPFGYSRRMWGPNWVLDQSMLQNAKFKERFAYLSYAATAIPGVALVGAEPDLVQGAAAGTLTYTVATNMLQWAGGSPVEALEGELFLAGVSTSPAWILGNSGPFALTAVSQYLDLNVGNGPVRIDLSLAAGWPNPTVAQLVAYITGAGGLGVGSVQSYNGKLLLGGVGYSQVEIGPCPSNAAPLVFGVDPGDLVCGRERMAGVSTLGIMGAFDISQNSIFEYDYTAVPLTRKIRWGSPGNVGAPSFGWRTITADGEYTLTDVAGHTMKVHCVVDQMPTTVPGVTLPFSINYSKVVSAPDEAAGLTVRVDPEQLPSVNASEVISLVDDATSGIPELPDNWWFDTTTGATVTTISASLVTDDRLEPLDAAPAYRVRLADPTLASMTLFGRVLARPLAGGHRGSSCPQVSPGLLYDYEGYEATFSGWFLNLTANTLDVTLSFSFDEGVTWVAGTATSITADTVGSGYEDAVYAEVSSVIPAGLTDNEVRVRAQFAAGAVGVDAYIDTPRVDVKYITSRCLADTTIARWRHRQYFGELLWIWSPEPLTLVEQAYIGVPHKSVSKDAPYSGVRVQQISTEAPAGEGTLEYKYNSLGDIHALRWTAYGEVWGPGNGWTSILSTGSLTIYTQGGSSLTVGIEYPLLPVLSSTPPEATVSTELTISDLTTEQGHVRGISPAHSSIDIFDATEYDHGGFPINLLGAITEADFSVCTLVNLDIEPSSPFKYSFVFPDVLPQEDEALTFTAAAPHRATLLYDSDQDMDSSLMLQDGVPVPNDLWQFNSTAEIQFINPADYSSGSTYVFSYEPLHQIETPTITLPAFYGEYAWWVDYYLWDRKDHNRVGRSETVPLFFNMDNSRAVLDYRSDMDQTQAVMYMETDQGTEDLPTANWRFIDPYTVEIDGSQYVRGALYYLTHNEERLYPQTRLSVTFEHRSAVDAVALAAASWVSVERNENIAVNQVAGGHVLHQLRLSVSGIRDLRDFKIRSLTIKGLRLHGSSPYVQGLTDI